VKLPNNEIGISDILDYRECPQRHAFGMRRHVALPERLQLYAGETDEAPGSTNWTNAYGSAIHHAIHLVDKDGLSHSAAIAEVMVEYGTYLEPGDLQLLGEDLRLFERRRPLGVTLVASEAEMRVPLFVTDDGAQIYFRFKLDVLQRLIANPLIFLHRDYKSSRWRRTDAEVHKSEQMWAYNWGIHELYPECTTLLQTYDQLKFGEVQTTKNDQQRDEIKAWLIANVKIILADEVYKPKQNDFCRYCALIVTCRETHRATAYWRGRMAVLAPLTKEGRKIKVEFAEEGDELERIIRDELPKMQQTRKHLELVEELLKDLLTQMDDVERDRLGWRLKDRKARAIAPEGLRELHEAMGDTFYDLVTLPITRLEEMTGKPKRGEPVPPLLQIARDWTTEETGGTNIERIDWSS
jgi:CRISPR/Cas system-associated exonuclease Cas4 (RecB family)